MKTQTVDEKLEEIKKLEEITATIREVIEAGDALLAACEEHVRVATESTDPDDWVETMEALECAMEAYRDTREMPKNEKSTISNKSLDALAEVTRTGALDMQVCVPCYWTDEHVLAFANRRNWSGTAGGWRIRRQGDPLLVGKNERVSCEGRGDFVHIMLDA